MGWSRSRRVVAAAGAVAFVVVLVAAVRAEVEGIGTSQAAQPVLVPVVGVAFVLAGVVIQTGWPRRFAPILLMAVGVAWLLPSVLPSTLLWHQGLLLVALLAFGGRWRWQQLLVACWAVPVALGVTGQLGTALGFAAVAVVGVAPRGPDRAVGYLHAVAASLVAVTLGLLWGWRREAPGYDPELGLAGYELVLVVVALLLGVGGRIYVGRSSRLQNRLLARQPLEGLAGLALVLRDVVGDPSLRLLPPGSPGMPVREGDRTLAVVSAREGTLADLAVADAVVRAVRLVAVWDERRTGLERSRASLATARERLARAVVEERAAMGEELGDHVLAKVHQLLVNLENTSLGSSDSVARAALKEARAQLRTAMSEVEATVAGASPILADEGLAGALAALAARSTVPCSFRSSGAADGRTDPAVERALFYVCSEALANVHKHAAAAGVQVELETAGDQLVLRVSDDGAGGADPAGPGLRGLAGRLVPLGGRLEVNSPSGAGTQLVATCPHRPQRVDAIRFQGRSDKW